MKPRLRSRDLRAIRIGLALAVPLGLGIFVVRPMEQARDELRVELARQERLLARELAILAARDGLRNALSDRLSFIGQARPVTFDGGGAMAGSSLTERIAAIAEGRGLEVTSAESRGISAEAGGLQLVEMDIVLVGDWSSVLRFLTRLREDDKYVRLSSFSLSRVGSVRSDGRTALQLTGRVAGLLAPTSGAAPTQPGGSP